MNPELMEALLFRALPLTNRISDVLNESDDIREQDTKLVVVAALLYSAGWAAASGLTLESFLTLATTCYARADVEPKVDDADSQEGN